MHGKVIACIVLCFLLSCPGFPCAAHSLGLSAGRTIYVDAGNVAGPWDGTLEHPFQHINDGIFHAVDGDTVYVFSGLYVENVRVNRSIALFGENRETTIIDANFTGCPVALKSNGVTLSGFTVQNSGTIPDNDTGIQLKNWIYEVTDNDVIRHNKVVHNFDGIFLIYSHNDTFSDNLIVNNTRYGFYAQSQAYNCTVSNNTVKDNGCSGVFFFFSFNNRVSHNVIVNNSGVDIDVWQSDSTVISYNVLSGNSDKGIYLLQSYYTTISHNYFSNLSMGVDLLSNTKYNDIDGNTFIHTNLGLAVTSATHTLVRKNNFIDNKVHAWFGYSFLYWVLIPGLTVWNKNYWDRGNQSGRYAILGHMTIGVHVVDWYQYDLFPAAKPYKNL